MRIGSVVPCCVAALLIAGCGGSASPAAHTATPRPSASATPLNTTPPPSATASAGVLRLGASDSGSSLNATVGTVIQVDLAAVPGFRWSAPRTSAPASVRLDASSAAPDGSASARFTVVDMGRTVLTASDDPSCLATEPACGVPSRQWSVLIVIGE